MVAVVTAFFDSPDDNCFPMYLYHHPAMRGRQWHIAVKPKLVRTAKLVKRMLTHQVRENVSNSSRSA
jgi:hypothetical protein